MIMQRMFQLILVGLVASSGVVSAEPAGFKFEFGTNQVRPGWTRPSVTNQYTPELGYGFENLASLGAGKDFVSSEQPFQFSVRLSEGNYLITVALGGTAKSDVSIKAEARRLMVERVGVAGRETVTRTFTVNVRRPEFGAGARVRLKQREVDTEMITWDDKLTLEFLGNIPSVRALEIVPTNVPTIFLTGDSTVCDQPREPWNSWGQMLPRFFGSGVAVANYAQSGESIKSSLSAKRFDKVFSLMKTNDWLFVQFGHNDMKDKATNALVVYKANLKKIVAQTRERGATPVLVTSMERKNGIEQDTLAGYPQTVQDVAKEDGVALIDLHAMSKVFYRALGPNLAKAFQDGTHHNNYGSYELARCVVAGIRANLPALANFATADSGGFDPAHPDDPAQFKLPASLAVDPKKPDGN